MNGYIKNVSPIWVHALKRAIRPGGQVPLNELYDQYGQKHGLAKGKEFVEWLRTVKLKDSDRWEVLLQDDVATGSDDVPVDDTEDNDTNKQEQTMSVVPKDMSVSNVVDLSVRKAKETMPKITDLKLLQYSLKEAGTRAGKDSLCRIIRSRIKQLQLAKAG